MSRPPMRLVVEGRQKPIRIVHTVARPALICSRAGAGIVEIRTPYRAPLANSIAERVVRTFRQECLDHVVVFNEWHLLALLTEFVHYYNHDRPHRTIELEAPVPNPPVSRGDVVSRPILGGLHHVIRGRHERCTYAALQPTPHG
ncbi:MAG TPA: integrase core domain-containing protein [Candidatus Dormibacteraeota bacterium]|nr:integrase core domain-containing protein [Candidatus Dormibacteraeota bacterium]